MNRIVTSFLLSVLSLKVFSHAHCYSVQFLKHISYYISNVIKHYGSDVNCLWNSALDRSAILPPPTNILWHHGFAT